MGGEIEDEEGKRPTEGRGHSIMANQQHLDKLLKEGVEAWNRWRLDHWDTQPALQGADLQGADLRKANLQKANLIGARLQGADLSEADLGEADLTEANLEGAFLMGANLEKAFLKKAHLEGTTLRETPLKGAFLVGASLEGAEAVGANLAGADLSEAHLEGANLSEAHLEGAVLSRTHFEGANLRGACFEGKEVRPDDRARISNWKSFPDKLWPANLRLAFFDAATLLEDASFGEEQFGSVWLADVHWGNVNLSVVDWTKVEMLGDESEAHRQKQLSAYRSAVRANRQLAAVLRDQGLNEESNGFAYHAHELQRTVFRESLLQKPMKRNEHKWMNSVLFLLQKYYRRMRLSGVLIMLVLILWHFLPGRPQGTLLEQRAEIELLFVWAVITVLFFSTPVLQLFWLIMLQFLAPLLLIWLVSTPLSSLLRIPSLLLSLFILVLLIIVPWKTLEAYRRYFSLLFPLLIDGVKFLLLTFLNQLAGYGYTPLRSVRAYLIVVGGFALLYYFLGVQYGPPLNSYEAMITSLISFHGRGFLFNQSGLGSQMAAAAAVEAMIGLVIEISLVATFTQRFFGK